MVAVVQLVRASDCGSECRRFESDQPPKENDPKENWVVLFLRGCIKRAILRLAKPEKAQFTKRKCHCVRAMFATTGTLVPQRSAEGFEGERNDKRAFLDSLFFLFPSPSRSLSVK